MLLQVLAGPSSVLASVIKTMCTLNITPASAINAAWGSQWYQYSCTLAETRLEKKRAIFGYFPEKSERT